MSEPRRRLLLLRHGQTAYNATGRFQGQRDEPLDEVGRQQARTTAPVIAGMRPTVLVSSDLRRAVDTARCIADLTGLPLAVDAGLREINLGTWAGCTAEEAAALFPDEYAAWAGGEDVRRGGGETYPEVADRAAAVLEPLLAGLEPDGLAVVVTHGGTTRSVVGRMLGLPPEGWHALGGVRNCEWVELREGQRSGRGGQRAGRGGWRLQRYGMHA